MWRSSSLTNLHVCLLAFAVWSAPSAPHSQQLVSDIVEATWQRRQDDVSIQRQLENADAVVGVKVVAGAVARHAVVCRCCLISPPLWWFVGAQGVYHACKMVVAITSIIELEGELAKMLASPRRPAGR